ncbi:hypothetical protein [Burkholderia gladioli]|uniref:hypothetical protein n=1 Tax=Burkholderia gladioli TaxID=28095 RepID=UPI00164074D0|nr:hypothetical protein [Burkholderia gladioli]
MAGELIFYTTEDGTDRGLLRADGGKVWLSLLAIGAQVAEWLALERHAEIDSRRRGAERLASNAEGVQGVKRIEWQLEKKSRGGAK